MSLPGAPSTPLHYAQDRLRRRSNLCRNRDCFAPLAMPPSPRPGNRETSVETYSWISLAEPTSPLQQRDGQIRRQRILEAIKRLLVCENLNQLLLIIFEDLHWLDNETQAFLQLLSESVPTACILLLVNYSPEYQHQ